MKIWLDDERPAPPGWMHVKKASEAFHILRNEPDVDEISLDHDLGDDEDGTGYSVLVALERWAAAGWLDEYIPEKITVHSANSVGRRKMQAAIDSIERLRNGHV